MYQAGIYWILGIVRKGDRLLINPVIPNNWKGFYVLYRHGNTKYHIEVKNPDGTGHGMAEIFEDGHKRENGIKLIDDGRDHKIAVTIKYREPAYIN
jgi:cyclic beta-1,2-glucan synthetase